MELSASRAAKGRPRLGREATDCATARLFACASRRSTLNNSSRIGRSLSHGDAFRENQIGGALRSWARPSGLDLTMSASAGWAPAARRIGEAGTIGTVQRSSDAP